MADQRFKIFHYEDRLVSLFFAAFLILAPIIIALFEMFGNRARLNVTLLMFGFAAIGTVAWVVIYRGLRSRLLAISERGLVESGFLFGSKEMKWDDICLAKASEYRPSFHWQKPARKVTQLDIVDTSGHTIRINGSIEGFDEIIELLRLMIPEGAWQ